MSRIGKKPIDILKGVEVNIDSPSPDTFVVSVKGPKGSLTVDVPQGASVKKDGEQIIVEVKKPEEKHNRSIWGLSRTLINNAILGVTEGYEKKLEINGVGFKAAVQGNNLVLNVGFSHPVEYKIPEGLKIEVEKNLITITGIDKQLLGQTAAEIRAIKKPEPYKGKGIKYIDEQIRRKAGKVVKT